MAAKQRSKQIGGKSTPQWRSVLDGEFEVSDHGKIRRARARKRKTAFIGRELKCSVNNRGYRSFTHWRNGKAHFILVHSVVAKAFMGECPPGMEINHKDGNPENN